MTRRLCAGVTLAATVLLGVPVVAAAPTCSSAPVVAPPPVWSVDCRGAGPGTPVSFPDSGDGGVPPSCLLGFFYRGSDGETYASAPGSCYLTVTSPQPRSYKARKAPVVRDASDRILGEVAFALNDGEIDFGLVRIRRGISFDPQLCHFGGPTRTETGSSGGPMTAQQVDYFTAQQIVLPTGLGDAHRLTAGGVALTSALVTTEDGALIGTVVPNLVSWTTQVNGPGLVTVERPQRGLAAAARTLRIRLTLMTAPLVA